ncbi:phosphonate C-P lyase system protein PhnG [Escherichia coli]|uniref:phosphonate C-P lyase system protein PhnG n=1 Tax=Escherichia coli TaxID=562 RepID=UPI00320B3AA5
MRLSAPPKPAWCRFRRGWAGTGERFFAGDATLTRAAVRLTDGTLGYSWVLGRDKQHAERCALIDALMQQSRYFQNLSETLIAPAGR